ncbi:MAG: hypothetical protein ACLRQA_11010, partial [Anaerovoracaceae bacterium]
RHRVFGIMGLSSVAASVFPDYRQLSLRQGFTIFSSVFQDDFHGEYPDSLQNSPLRASYYRGKVGIHAVAIFRPHPNSVRAAQAAAGHPHLP